MPDKRNVKGKVDTTGDAIGAGTGGVAGAAAGAAIGSLGGPIGSIIGALAGGVGGWWSGRAVSEAMSTYSKDDDEYYRSRFGAGGASGSYDEARPAYQLGHLAGVNPDYQNRSFDEVERDLRGAYTSAGQDNWDDVRDHAREAYTRGREVGEHRLTLAEEELRVEKRQVAAGEVALRKTVETRHVEQEVPLAFEEVEIERRPITDANASTDIEIREDSIRIPVMGEEAVVEKRVVGLEEVVLKKERVTENQSVEGDLRRERLDVDRTGDHLAASSDVAGEATPGTTRGSKSLGDSMADGIDDIKDRVDGNPASRPGRDATDRPGR